VSGENTCARNANDAVDMPWRLAAAPPGRQRAKSLQNLALEIMDFWEWVKPGREERTVRQILLQRVQAAVHRLWPRAKVKAYGSHIVESLATFESDVDMRVDGWHAPWDHWEAAPGGQWRLLSDDYREFQARALHALHEVISHEGWAVSLELRDRAVVPIITCVDLASGISLDITLGDDQYFLAKAAGAPRLRSALGQDTTAVAAAFVQRWPTLFPPLVALMKVLFAQHGLDKPFSGGIGSFKLYCLVAFFLQNVQQLPPCANSVADIVVGSAEDGCPSRMPKKFAYKSVGRAAVDFLGYLGQGLPNMRFSFAQVLLFDLQGRCVPPEDPQFPHLQTAVPHADRVLCADYFAVWDWQRIAAFCWDVRAKLLACESELDAGSSVAGVPPEGHGIASPAAAWARRGRGYLECVFNTNELRRSRDWARAQAVDTLAAVTAVAPPTPSPSARQLSPSVGHGPGAEEGGMSLAQATPASPATQAKPVAFSDQLGPLMQLPATADETIIAGPCESPPGSTASPLSASEADEEGGACVAAGRAAWWGGALSISLVSGSDNERSRPGDSWTASTSASTSSASSEGCSRSTSPSGRRRSPSRRHRAGSLPKAKQQEAPTWPLHARTAPETLPDELLNEGFLSDSSADSAAQARLALVCRNSPRQSWKSPSLSPPLPAPSGEESSALRSVTPMTPPTLPQCESRGRSMLPWRRGSTTGDSSYGAGEAMGSTTTTNSHRRLSRFDVADDRTRGSWKKNWREGAIGERKICKGSSAAGLKESWHEKMATGKETMHRPTSSNFVNPTESWSRVVMRGTTGK